MDLIREDGVLHVLKKPRPIAVSSFSAVINKVKRQREKERKRLVLNIEEKPIKLIKLLFPENGTTKTEWKNFQIRTNRKTFNQS